MKFIFNKNENIKQKIKIPEDDLKSFKKSVEKKTDIIYGDSFDKLKDEEQIKIIRESLEEQKQKVIEEVDYKLLKKKKITQEILKKISGDEDDEVVLKYIDSIEQTGIINTITTIEQLKDPHLLDDFHKFLVQYIKNDYDFGISKKESIYPGLKLTLFEIVLPSMDQDEEETKQKKLDEVLLYMEQFYAGMVAISDSLKERYFTIEISYPQHRGQVSFYCAVPNDRVGLFKNHILAVFSDAKIKEATEDYNIFNHSDYIAASRLKFTESDFLPIKTYKELGYDPLNIVLQAFSNFSYDEGAAIQILVSPLKDDDMDKKIAKKIDQLNKGEDINLVLGKVHPVVIYIRKVIKLLRRKDEKESSDIKDQEKRSNLVEQMKNKNSSRLYKTEIRFITAGESLEHARELLTELESAFLQFENVNGNKFKFEKVWTSQISKFVRKFIFRILDKKRTVLLNIPELTSIFHFPRQKLGSSDLLTSSNMASAQISTKILALSKKEESKRKKEEKKKEDEISQVLPPSFDIEDIGEFDGKKEKNNNIIENVEDNTENDEDELDKSIEELKEIDLTELGIDLDLDRYEKELKDEKQRKKENKKEDKKSETEGGFRERYKKIKELEEDKIELFDDDDKYDDKDGDSDFNNDTEDILDQLFKDNLSDYDQVKLNNKKKEEQKKDDRDGKVKEFENRKEKIKREIEKKKEFLKLQKEEIKREKKEEDEERKKEIEKEIESQKKKNKQSKTIKKVEGKKEEEKKKGGLANMGDQSFKEGKNIILGINDYQGKETPIYFTPVDRMRHMYVIGQTGTGKTTILKNMIVQDIKNGDGVCFMDPHGSDIEDILAQIPPERADDVIYFDPAHLDRPMGLNMLEYDARYPEQKSFLVNELLAIFDKLFDMKKNGSGGPMFEMYFRNAVMLAIDNPDDNATLFDVSRVLSDADFRKKKLEKSTNLIVNQFWTKIAEQAGGEASMENIVPYITSKFDGFLSNDYMRPILTQEKSAFNFRDIMDTRKILLINLSKGRLGDINANLIGLIIVGKILMAALSRVDSLDKNLPPFYLYIDEFQNVTTDSISQILSEARKYKLSLNIAHQYIKQIDEPIRDAVFGNVGSMAIFRVGQEDAEFLAKQLEPTFNAKDITSISNWNAFLKMLVNGDPQKPFNIRTLPPEAGNPEMIQKLKELSWMKYGVDRRILEEQIRQKIQFL